MGKTFKRNDRWKKDRRDQSFKKSKKFKEFQQKSVHPIKHKEIPSIEIEEDYDSSNN